MIPTKPKYRPARRRYNLWIKHPYCYWCDRKLKWKQSTLDHLNSRVARRKRPNIPRQVATVLSCKPCNNRRALKEIQSMPKWKWWVRSRSFPRITTPGLSLSERFIVLTLGSVIRSAARN